MRYSQSNMQNDESSTLKRLLSHMLVAAIMRIDDEVKGFGRYERFNIA